MIRTDSDPYTMGLSPEETRAWKIGYKQALNDIWHACRDLPEGNRYGLGIEIEVLLENS